MPLALRVRVLIEDWTSSGAVGRVWCLCIERHHRNHCCQIWKSLGHSWALILVPMAFVDFLIQWIFQTAGYAALTVAWAWVSGCLSPCSAPIFVCFQTRIPSQPYACLTHHINLQCLWQRQSPYYHGWLLKDTFVVVWILLLIRHCVAARHTWSQTGPWIISCWKFFIP